MFLLVFTALLGALGGAIYGLYRMVLRGPPWLIAILAGLAVASGAGGGFIVTADGVDFRILEPLWLAIALFMVLPGAWAASVVLLTERLLRPGALYRELPRRIGDRFGGVGANVLAWSSIAAMAAFGLLDLSHQVAELS